MPTNDDGTIPPVGGPKPAAATDAADAAEATAPTDATASVDAPSPNTAIAEALRAGEITPEQAQAQIIDEVVRNQLGADAPDKLVESVRTEVAALLEGDPALMALLE